MKWTGLSMKWTRFPNRIDTQQQKRERVWLNASPSLDHHTSGEKGLAAIITVVAKSFSLELSLEAVPSSSPIPEIKRAASTTSTSIRPANHKQRWGS
ncbi:hypothetical protein L2E82_27752 [Cichorium intybus]|uniref:Uncharacterized protein n=1 Tax=Cichorium intybus TaxID=13427 RepID=A0ACB9CU10_CICIN|nr:hypothetical protein L2E82_27752 [Cichorium intybus]